MIHQEIIPDVQIRIARPTDLDQLMSLAVMGFAENGVGAPDMEEIVQDVYCCANLIDGLSGVIGPPEGPLEAMVILRAGKLRYSTSVALEEKIIFVKPEFRSAKGGRAAKLCKFSVDVADRMKLPLTIGVLSSVRTEAKVRMYSRLLGPPTGAYWLHGISTGH